MKRAIVVLIVALLLGGCAWQQVGPVAETEPGPMEINAVVTRNTLPGESCGTSAHYCRKVVLLCIYWVEPETVRWEFDGRHVPDGDNVTAFLYDFLTLSDRAVHVTVVDKLGRVYEYSGTMRVVREW